MAEQKLFGYAYETNCDVMILVRRQGVTRLMSIKQNPYLRREEDVNTERKMQNV